MKQPDSADNKSGPPWDDKTRALVARLQALLKLDHEQACRAAGVDPRRLSAEEPASDDNASKQQIARGFQGE